MKGEVFVSGGQVDWSGGESFRVKCFPIIKGVTQTQVKHLDLTAAHGKIAQAWVVAIKNFTAASAGSGAGSGAESRKADHPNAVRKLGLLMQYVISSIGEPTEEAVDAVFNAPVSQVLVTRFCTLFSSYPIPRGAKVLSAVADIGVVTEAVKHQLLQLVEPLVPVKLYLDLVAAVCSDGNAEKHHVEAAVRQLLALHQDVDTTLLQGVCTYVYHFGSASLPQLQRLVNAFVPAFIPQSTARGQVLDSAFVRAANNAPRVFSWLVRHATSVFEPSNTTSKSDSENKPLVDLTLSRGDMLQRLSELGGTSGMEDTFEAEPTTSSARPAGTGSRTLGSRQSNIGSLRGGLRNSSRRLGRSSRRLGGRGAAKGALDHSHRIVLRPFVPPPLKAPTLTLLDTAAQQCDNPEALHHILEAVRILRGIKTAAEEEAAAEASAGGGSNQSISATSARAVRALGLVLVGDFLPWNEACRTQLVCRKWRAWHTSQQHATAGRLWQEVAATAVLRDFGEGAIDSLYDADLHASCEPTKNPWFEIAQRVAHCEYWQVPEDVHGNPCCYVIVDLSRSDCVVVGAAALQDSRPLVLPRHGLKAGSKDGDKEYVAKEAGHGEDGGFAGLPQYAQGVLADIKRALTKLLGSWTWLRCAPGTRLVLLDDPDLRWLQHRATIEAAIVSEINPGGGLQFIDPLAAAFLITSNSGDGLVVDAGRRWTRVLPVCSHQPQAFAASSEPNGGDAVTSFLRRQLQIAGHAIRQVDAEVVRDAACFVLTAPGGGACDCSTRGESTVDFGDGRSVKLEHARHEACEVVFDPRLDGHDYCGLAEQLAQSVQRCGIDTRRPLLSNVFILDEDGSFARLPGFVDRLQAELARACQQPPDLVKVFSHGAKSQLYPYLGACIYLENGP
eukprot:INCI11703.1.p1 GENE.INCI11703.1~~INCI11703.1.p1  ORF type:complete len:988 (-),score=155.09 INCI11703.1:172-2862(-)